MLKRGEIYLANLNPKKGNEVGVNGGVKFSGFFVEKLRKVTLSDEGLVYSFY
ncbi:MAG: hypothetical protein Q8N78_00560 [Sulfurimonas sp.]|nr:hypothetical protein [Sulfurimonas sp.]